MFSLTLFFPAVGRDDSQRKHTNLVFMLGLFAQCSHPYFLPSVSMSHCLRRFFFLSLLFSCIFQKIIWSLPCACVCVCVEKCVLCSKRALEKYTHTQTHRYADSESCCIIVLSVPAGNHRLYIKMEVDSESEANVPETCDQQRATPLIWPQSHVSSLSQYSIL